jgi:basic membrane protein A and related proteins
LIYCFLVVNSIIKIKRRKMKTGSIIQKVVMFMLASILVFSIVGCAATTPAPAASSGATGNQLPSGTKPVKVVFLTIQAMAPFEADVWRGINQAKTEGYASEVKLIQLKEPSEYEEGIRAVSQDGYDVVIATFEVLKPAIAAVAPDFPKTKYMNVWVSAPDPADKYPNVRGYVYNVEDGSYVNGVLAGKICGNQVGFVGGDDNAVIMRFLAGFEAGLKATNPSSTLNISFAGTYVDPVKGREIALSLFQRGVNCIMTAANQTGLGVIKAGQENQKMIFGVDVDQSKDAPDAVLSSALANAGESAYRTIKDAATNKWTGGTVNFGADDGAPAVAINMNFPGGIPAEALKAAQEAEAKIGKGEIKVPNTTTSR